MAVFTFSLGADGMMHTHRLRHIEVTVYDGHYWPELEGVPSLQMGRNAIDRRGSRSARISLTDLVRFHRHQLHEPPAGTLVRRSTT